MALATPTARYLDASDRRHLASFRCSKGEWFEDDVEHFISQALLKEHQHRAPHTDHALIGLELAEHGLAAVGSHEEDFLRVDGEEVRGTLLECGAVTIDLQGEVLEDVEPLEENRPVTLGRYLMELLLSDASRTSRVPIVRAVVARENVRSLRLCSRIGLADERADRDERFVSRLGYMRA